MQDPLIFLFQQYGFDKQKIARTVNGEKYFALVLNNGNIGLGATLHEKLPDHFPDFAVPDFTNISHRIAMTAYFNALLNYTSCYTKEVDIFDQVNFSKYRQIVMIGWCKPLYQKLKTAGSPVYIFDRDKQDDSVMPMHLQEKYLSGADCVIMTSTAVINGTFPSLIDMMPEYTDAYLFGPSGILNEKMLKYPNIKYIFGSVFRKNDENVLTLIARGEGTRSFSRYMRKVFIRR